MPVVVSNLAAVAGAPLTTVSMSTASQLLSGEEQERRQFVVAHKFTGAAYSTTIYDLLDHRLYRVTHPTTVRGWLSALAAERPTIRLLSVDERLNICVLERDPIIAAAVAALA